MVLWMWCFSIRRRNQVSRRSTLLGRAPNASAAKQRVSPGFKKENRPASCADRVLGAKDQVFGEPSEDSSRRSCKDKHTRGQLPSLPEAVSYLDALDRTAICKTVSWHSANVASFGKRTSGYARRMSASDPEPTWGRVSPMQRNERGNESSLFVQFRTERMTHAGGSPK